ncbi:MAG TPA: hypothetical protein VJ957_08530 [Longimicrobiales bacterium]|nr:hypothetical protein [Longimicrobiales bacterium]
MRVSKVVLALVTLFTLGGGAVSAQVPGIGLDIVPKIGGEFPLSDLPTTPSSIDVANIGSTLAWGVAAELGLPFLPFNLRADVSGTTSKSISPATGVTSNTVDQTMMAIFGDLVFRPLPKIILFKPYLMAGLGVKRYNYSLSDPTSVFQQSFTNTNDLAYHLGLGLDIGLGPLSLVAELNDYMNQYQYATGGSKKLQHDLFAMLGLRFGIL